MRWLYLITVLLLWGCLSDAPHDNPLESQAGLALRGMVQTYYPPHQPLGMVNVHLKELKLTTLTDGSGQFEFTHLKPDSYTIEIGGTNFSTDSVRLFLNKNMYLNFYLDQLPQFQDIQITSHHQARWFPVEDQYLLQVFVKLTDPDGIGDLQLACYQIPKLSIKDTLAPGPDPGEFYISRKAEYFNLSHLEQLIGQAFIISALDDAGFSSSSAPHYLTRIINATVLLISPIGLQTVTSDTIHFQWQPVYLPFSYHYKLEIFQINNGVVSTVQTIDSLSSELTDLRWVQQLPSGEYLWRIYIVDEFGNTSRSKEGAFQIP